MTDRYALHMPGARGWAYHLTRNIITDLPDELHPERSYQEPTWTTPDGTPLEPARRKAWFTHPERLTSVTASFRTRPRVIGYKLSDLSYRSPALPASLTVEEYRERTSGAYDSMTGQSYEEITEEQPPRTFPVDLAGLVELDGSPPPPTPPGARWEPSLPNSLANYPEYSHLFPGHLEGFRGALEHALKEIKGLKVYNFDKHNPPEFTVYVELRYDPTQTAPHTVQHGRRKPRIVQREIHHSERHQLSPPWRIKGENLAAAAERWEAKLAEWVGEFRAIAEEVPCGHCHGTGLAIRKLGETVT